MLSCRAGWDDPVGPDPVLVNHDHETIMANP